MEKRILVERGGCGTDSLVIHHAGWMKNKNKRESLRSCVGHHPHYRHFLETIIRRNSRCHTTPPNLISMASTHHIQLLVEGRDMCFYDFLRLFSFFAYAIFYGFFFFMDQKRFLLDCFCWCTCLNLQMNLFLFFFLFTSISTFLRGRIDLEALSNINLGSSLLTFDPRCVRGFTMYTLGFRTLIEYQFIFRS
ncbi:hypothetical protein DFH27DRAFT_59181 [Peziza echinospora]|nr:hypothetical protein DFH27DRAFT_59181 [Peziza echinospora]